MSWVEWVVLGVVVVVVPVVIGMVFASGRNMYGGPGTAGGGMFGPFEEIFAPSRHEAGKELEQQKLRRADVGSPDGPTPGTEEERPDPELRDPDREAPRPSATAVSDDPTHSRTTAPPPGWLDGSRR